MKTSNRILLVAALCFMAFAAVQIIDGYRQVRHQREVLRPVLEQIDSSDIRVIRMVRTNDNYVVSNHSDDYAGDNTRLIRFVRCHPDASTLRIEGDTLVVTHEGRVVVSFPSATIVERDSAAKEL